MAFLAGGHTIPHYLTNNEKNGVNITIGWNSWSSGYNFNHLKLLTSQTAVLQPLGRMVSPNLTLFYVTPPYQLSHRRRNPSARAQGQNSLDPSEAPRSVTPAVEQATAVFCRAFGARRAIAHIRGLPNLLPTIRLPVRNYNAGCRNRVAVRKLPGKEHLVIPTMSDHTTLCDKSVSRYQSTSAFPSVRRRILAQREISP